MKELDWSSPTTKKYIELARLKKMTLVGLGKNSNYKKYKFNKCGHEKDCTPQHLKGNPICLICMEERLKAEALRAGYILLGKGKKASTRIYKCSNCSYTFENFIRNIRIKKSQECPKCEEDRFKKEALKVGLELLSKGNKIRYRNYKFVKCGHEESFQLTNVRVGNIKCSKCAEIKLEKEAKEFNLKLLGPGKKSSMRKYKFLDCGHTREMEPGNIRRGNFSCQICEDTSRTQPSNVYLLKIKTDKMQWLKLGYSKRIPSRIKQYQLPKNSKIQKLSVIKFQTGNAAHKFESSLHKKFKKHRLAPMKMKKFHTTGYDECYPIKMKESLLKELNSHDLN